MIKEQEQMNTVEQLKSELQGFSAEQILKYFLERYRGQIAFSSSMAAEDQVVTDMICGVDPSAEIFTLDTGRLPQESYDTIEKTNARYGIKIKMYFPDSRHVEEMLSESGPNFFYRSLEERKRCCYIRKIEPLKRALKGKKVWICGIRKEQSVTRQDMEPVQWDDTFKVIKVSPILDWSTEEVWDYIKENKVPYNRLHDKGYPSIGCAPCTRAVENGQDIRAGRWWWENPEHKECGLHLDSN